MMNTRKINLVLTAACMFYQLLLSMIPLIIIQRRQERRKWLRDEKRASKAFKHFKTIKYKLPRELFSLTRMSSRGNFNELLLKIHDKIPRKVSTKYGIGCEQLLYMTLRYLAHQDPKGDSIKSLAWTFNLKESILEKCIYITCKTISSCLVNEFLIIPREADQWESIAAKFENKCNFPHCLGDLDAKVIALKAPTDSESDSSDEKKSSNLVLLAACDTNYKFTMIDIHVLDSTTDGGIFKNNLLFNEFLKEGKLDIPAPETLNNETETEIPYMFVADVEFPLTTHVIRPYGGKNLSYEEKVFNYRLSRAKKPIDNALGILVSRWRILKQTIAAKPKNANLLIMTCILLHNYCMTKQRQQYCMKGYTDSDDNTDGMWREEIKPLQAARISRSHSSRDLCKIREALTDYFLSDYGELPGQFEYVTKGSGAE